MSTLPPSVRESILALFDRYPTKQAVTLPALHLVQESLRCVPRAAVVEIANLLELSPAQVDDTLSFYGFFRDESRPAGRQRVWICRSLSCMLRGSEQLLADVCARLHVAPGQTTPNGQVTLEVAECLGGCEGAPCIMINDVLHFDAEADAVVQLAEDSA